MNKFIESAQKTINIELAAIQNLHDRINDDFARACQYLLDCKHRIVVMGMGKSGHIGRKIAATLASTGSPALFVHPAEASHGDLGMITAGDVILAISYSGETTEIQVLLPIIKRLGCPLIALTGKPQSTLAKEANVNIDVHVQKEAGPFDLAPTSSTTATLVIGDALAIALLEARGFTKEDFARSHPGGQLGRRLLLRIADIMHSGDAIPKVTEDILLTHAILEMTRKSLGMTSIVDSDNHLLGIYTDGDLRRTLDQGIDIRQTTIGKVMTRHCTTVNENMLAAETLQLMEKLKINSFLVTNENNQVTGAFNFIDLLRAGVT